MGCDSSGWPSPYRCSPLLSSGDVQTLGHRTEEDMALAAPSFRQGPLGHLAPAPMLMATARVTGQAQPQDTQLLTAPRAETKKPRKSSSNPEAGSGPGTQTAPLVKKGRPRTASAGRCPGARGHPAQGTRSSGPALGLRWPWATPWGQLRRTPHTSHCPLPLPARPACLPPPPSNPDPGRGSAPGWRLRPRHQHSPRERLRARPPPARAPSRRASRSLRRSSARRSRSFCSRCSFCCSRSFRSRSRFLSSCSRRSLQRALPAFRRRTGGLALHLRDVFLGYSTRPTKGFLQAARAREAVPRGRWSARSCGQAHARPSAASRGRGRQPRGTCTRARPAPHGGERRGGTSDTMGSGGSCSKVGYRLEYREHRGPE